MGRRCRLGIGGQLMIWVYIGAVVIMIVATLILRGRRPDSGMTTYRKHIDALSSDARRGVREVHNRNQSDKRRTR